jgi:N-methylhydantoinase B
VIGHFLPGLIFGALAPALPGRLMAGGAEPVWISIWRGERAGSAERFSFTLFQLGGTGARATKDGLDATGFPSGVGGVPAEVIESLAPLVQTRRELRTDSGGAGRYRGGLGQRTEMRCVSGKPWSVSGMIDRVDHPAQGLDGGRPGAPGELRLDDGSRPRPKALIGLDPTARVALDLPGGAGYGDPLDRDPRRVLEDVVDGRVSIEAAAREYGVVIRFLGAPEQLVRLPEHYRIERVER